jgi:type I restriction enzyme S subunit
MNYDKNNIPSLRFPEFKGDWEKKKLGEVNIKIIDGDRGVNYPNGNDFSERGYCLFMNAKNVTKNGFSFVEKSFITKEKDELLRKGKLQRFDIILTTRGSVGHISYYDLSVPFEHLRINSGMVLIRTNQEIINSDYLYKYFNSNQIQREIDTVAFGSAQPQLTVGEILKFNLSFPTLAEQTKIANLFTAIDEKLQSLKKKKQLLELYKKGAMQQLFSQELRFKEDNGNELPKWVMKKLGEVCEVIMGQSPSSNSYNSDEIGIPLIQGNADIRNRLSNPKNWTTEKTKECKIGDLILTVRAPVGAVAKSIHNACIGRGVCAIKNNSRSINEFIYQFLLDYETKWSSLEQGSTFTAVSGLEIKKLEIPIPSLPEQTKIANFLSSLDEKINSTNNQITKTQEWKKGLLQQMFV